MTALQGLLANVQHPLQENTNLDDREQQQTHTPVTTNNNEAVLPDKTNEVALDRQIVTDQGGGVAVTDVDGVANNQQQDTVQPMDNVDINAQHGKPNATTYAAAVTRPRAPTPEAGWNLALSEKDKRTKRKEAQAERLRNGSQSTPGHQHPTMHKYNKPDGNRSPGVQKTTFKLTGAPRVEVHNLYLENIKIPPGSKNGEIIRSIVDYAGQHNVRVMSCFVKRNRVSRNQVGCKVTVPVNQVHKCKFSDMWPEHVKCRDWEQKPRKQKRNWNSWFGMSSGVNQNDRTNTELTDYDRYQDFRYDEDHNDNGEYYHYDNDY